MRDYVLALDAEVARSIRSDYYALHQRLYAAFGDRRDGCLRESPVRWQFSSDPRAILSGAGCGFVLVRATADVESRVAPLAVAVQDVYIPRPGERVRFHLHACAKLARDDSYAERRLRARSEGRDVSREAVKTLMARSGFGDVSVGPLSETRFDVAVSRGKMVPKWGISASGEAVVSDAARASVAMREGVGRDRGFGFGILVLEPLRRS